MQFRQTPADYCYSWHTAPRRQFIVNLDADVEIQVSSGEKRVIPKGEVFFVEDTTGQQIIHHKLYIYEVAGYSHQGKVSFLQAYQYRPQEFIRK